MLYSKHNEIKIPSLSIAPEKKLWEVLCKTLQICYQQAVLRSAHTRCLLSCSSDLTLQISPTPWHWHIDTSGRTYWHLNDHGCTVDCTMCQEFYTAVNVTSKRGGAREIFSVLCYSTLGQDLADNNNGRDRSDDDWCPVYTHTPHTC